MTDDLESFRLETREWLKANVPQSMREPVRGDKDINWGGRRADYANNPEQKLYMDRMAERGWTVPDWPVEYGGGGLSAAHTKILKEEMRRINARIPLSSFGISMLGPALLKYGNEAQKREHLPKIARGEIRWCQGYSEPNAGSDLAGLATSAEDKGRLRANVSPLVTAAAPRIAAEAPRRFSEPRSLAHRPQLPLWPGHTSSDQESTRCISLPSSSSYALRGDPSNFSRQANDSTGFLDNLVGAHSG